MCSSAGCLKLLTVIVACEAEIKERLAPSLLTDLFAIAVVLPSGAFAAKCLHPRSRAAVFGLMKELSRGSQSLHEIALNLVAPIARAVADGKKDSAVAVLLQVLLSFSHSANINDSVARILSDS